MKNKGDDFIICVIYRRPNSSVQFWDNLNIALERANEQCKRIVILGDINEDQLNPNNNKLKNLIQSNGLRNIIIEPTRVTQHTATSIDPIIVPDDFNVLNSGVLSIPEEISDHRATYAILPFSYNLAKCYERHIWSYKRANFKQLNDLITNTNWDFLLNNGDINECCLIKT